MTADELIARLRGAGCRIVIDRNAQVAVLTQTKAIADDLGERGARVDMYIRNPAGARDLGEEPIVEWDVSLRGGMSGIKGPGNKPVRLVDFVEAARKS